ncbi:MAG: hypothetical protein LBF57_01085 [Holosporaceae bacterium]|nr:hypothetical protein [Holosporaceae bacterium]
MIKVWFVCVVCLVTTANAYDFDIVVKNESGHRFDIVKDLRITQSSCSDVNYSSNEMRTSAVLTSPVRLHLHLSIIDYKSAKERDSIGFFNEHGRFLVKFSKPTAACPCPYPILFGITSAQEDQTSIVDGTYSIGCVYSKASGGYVITIKTQVH